MAVASTVFVKKIHLYASQFATLFRVNTGTGWVGGRPIKVTRDGMMKVSKGDVLIPQGRPFKAGLHVGGGDLFGWQSIVITSEMVGKKVAVVVNLECKYGTGRLSPEQKNFIDQVNDAGGIAGEIKGEGDVLALLSSNI